MQDGRVKEGLKFGQRTKRAGAEFKTTTPVVAIVFRLGQTAVARIGDVV